MGYFAWVATISCTVDFAVNCGMQWVSFIVHYFCSLNIWTPVQNGMPHVVHYVGCRGQFWLYYAFVKHFSIDYNQYRVISKLFSGVLRGSLTFLTAFCQQGECIVLQNNKSSYYIVGFLSDMVTLEKSRAAADAVNEMEVIPPLNLSLKPLLSNTDAIVWNGTGNVGCPFSAIFPSSHFS